MVENLREVKCLQKTSHCFLEIYRLEVQTWFNGQCDDFAACIHESDYTVEYGCQATFHGGDRCCCRTKNCNFDRILSERPSFRRFLPVDDIKTDEIKKAVKCGKKQEKISWD
ncbi:unnamed protein product [Dracunculus medinensis]|uniref:Uncharacterized protein n=1 Tax=Dracunculus medinensis TaxID=318479 RepID=A0A0N4UBQ2_DRAME|nr:unnamed protein product [Dracunculus medinensis]